jgi:alkyl sulfatase
MSTAVAAIGVNKVTANIGAEITGVKIGPDLPAPVVSQIRDALLEHKVLFFRGQHHLDDAGQAGFAALFGELGSGRRKKPGPPRYVKNVDNSSTRATVWHTDATLTLRPTAISMLRPMVLPPYGGDTAWANTATAYQRMGPELQELADQLWALHTNNLAARQLLLREAKVRAGAPGTSQQATVYAPEALDDPRRSQDYRPKNLYETEHPVVRVHPETGERSLLLGAFAKTILGRDDSDRLLDMFQAYVTSMDNQVRWHWGLGDVGMWDNRATQHCAIADYDNHKRLMHRVTILGEVPVSVDGRQSIAIEAPE